MTEQTDRTRTAPQDPDAIRAEIARTRQELGDIIEALSARMDVRTRAREALQVSRERARVRASELSGSSNVRMGAALVAAAGVAAMVLVIVLRRRAAARRRQQQRQAGLWLLRQPATYVSEVAAYRQRWRGMGRQSRRSWWPPTEWAPRSRRRTKAWRPW